MQPLAAELQDGIKLRRRQRVCRAFDHDRPEALAGGQADARKQVQRAESQL